MVSDLVAEKLQPHCQKCKSIYRLQVIQKRGFNQLCEKFRDEHQGIPFNVDIWRTFYSRHQIYITLCMECAYIDNLNAAHIIEKDPELQKLMAETQLKNIGAHDQFVARKLQLPHVRNIIQKWIELSRSSLLHFRGQKLRKARAKFRINQFKLDYALAKQNNRPLPKQPEVDLSASQNDTPNASDDSGGSTNSLTISSVGAV